MNLSCLSGGEERLAGAVGHRAGEVAQFHSVSRVQQELVDADVAVNDRRRVQVGHGVEHLHRISSNTALTSRAVFVKFH